MKLKNIKDFLSVNNVQIFLISLFPASIIAGPLIAEIIINLINIIYIYLIFKKGDFVILKNKVFLYLFAFYIYINLTTLVLPEDNKVIINSISYLRFIIFGFAFFDILKNNIQAIKYVYYSLAITLCCLIFDGYIQHFFGQNLLGVEKIRADRLSGLFFEDLILGGFLSRILLIYLGLIFLFKNKGNYQFYLNLTIFIFGYILVFLSGERAAFLVISLLIFILLISINIRLKHLSYVFIIFILSFLLIFKNNPILLDRYYDQLRYHLVGVGTKFDKDNFLPNYMSMYVTAFKMFQAKPIIGHGAKSFRYLCDNKEFTTLNKNSLYIEHYFEIYIPSLGKKDNYLIIEDSFFKIGDEITKGDNLFTYRLSDKKLKYFKSKLSGKIKFISEGKKFKELEPYLTLENPDNSLVYFDYKYRNGCNIHPHQIYLQLLAETGVIGFIFIFYIFIKISISLIKNFYNLRFNKKTSLSIFTICIYLSIFGNLWPLTTSGNFFNNWINFLFYYPLGFYLYSLYLQRKK